MPHAGSVTSLVVAFELSTKLLCILVGGGATHVIDSVEQIGGVSIEGRASLLSGQRFDTIVKAIQHLMSLCSYRTSHCKVLFGLFELPRLGLGNGCLVEADLASRGHPMLLQDVARD